MTDSDAPELVSLARSWLSAPEMIISSEGFNGGIYDMAERAYIIEKTAANKEILKIRLKGSEDSPVENPAFIIKNWGRDIAGVSINGEQLGNKDVLHQGVIQSPLGEDLIIWLRMKATKEIKINIYDIY